VDNQLFVHDRAKFAPVKRVGNLRIAGMIAVGTLLVAGTLAAGGSSAAFATTYPTYADLVAARSSQAATQALVNQIQGLLAGLDTQLDAANANAIATGNAAVLAEQKYTLAKDKQQTLEQQEKDAAAKAAKSRTQLATYASQLARGASSGGTSTMSLLLNGKATGQLLNDLGAIGQISKEQNALLENALSQQNSVKQLSTLAAAQSQILAVQKQAAEDAKAKAAAAAASLESAVEAAAAHPAELDVLLAAAKTNTALTQAGYNAGVVAAQGSGQAGIVDSQGWALPTVGVITSPWGYRYDPAQGYSWAFHYGDDIAHGCLQPIYAATAGTVTYAGVYSDFGNYISISHANGVSTQYGHIAGGKTFVHVGQQVPAGANIADTGSTGASTGCHLFFAVEVNGNPVDPVPFMSARGIKIG
jgi:murein DD-endopeptidase MepM/ murein hydrolase activator NlpD